MVPGVAVAIKVFMANPSLFRSSSRSPGPCGAALLRESLFSPALLPVAAGRQCVVILWECSLPWISKSKPPAPVSFAGNPEQTSITSHISVLCEFTPWQSKNLCSDIHLSLPPSTSKEAGMQIPLHLHFNYHNIHPALAPPAWPTCSLFAQAHWAPH